MNKVESATGAPEITIEFLKSYSRILQRSLSVKLDQGKWEMEKWVQ